MSSVQLHSGETLTIKLHEPPFEGGDVELCWWRELAADLLAGALRPWLHTCYYVGYIDGARVGYVSRMTPTDTRDVGLVEFVWTSEAQRRKGIASALLGRLVEDFTQSGGAALYLCTSNPDAGLLYERHGFRYLVGDGMRYLAPGAADFDSHYLAAAGPATVRDTTWADLPRAAVLYNHAEPRWFIKDVLSESFRDTRYESHFVKTFRRIEGRRGLSLVLENPQRHVVGMVTVERRGTFAEQHTGTLSFRVAPAYFGRSTTLLTAAIDGCAALGIGELDTSVADCDQDQAQLLEAVGFSMAARFQNRLRIDGQNRDLLVLTRAVPEAKAMLFEEGDFYGARKDWQKARIC